MKLTRDEHLYFNACAKALLACPDVQSMSAFTQHGRVSCLEHSLSVAYYSYWLCCTTFFSTTGTLSAGSTACMASPTPPPL